MRNSNDLSQKPSLFTVIASCSLCISVFAYYHHYSKCTTFSMLWKQIIRRLFVRNDGVEFFQEVFLSLGGHLHEGQEVNRIIPVHSNLVNVQTNKEIYSCHSVILTCGPWINKVLKPLNSKLPIKVRCA